MNGVNLRKPESIRLRSTANLQDLLDGWDMLTPEEVEELVRFSVERELVERNDAFYMRFANGSVSGEIRRQGANGEDLGYASVPLVRSKVTD